MNVITIRGEDIEVATLVWSFPLWLCIALGLILGGTTGNLFDRVVFGGTVVFRRRLATGAIRRSSWSPSPTSTIAGRVGNEAVLLSKFEDGLFAGHSKTLVDLMAKSAARSAGSAIKPGACGR